MVRSSIKTPYKVINMKRRIIKLVLLLLIVHLVNAALKPKTMNEIDSLKQHKAKTKRKQRKEVRQKKEENMKHMKKKQNSLYGHDNAKGTSTYHNTEDLFAKIETLPNINITWEDDIMVATINSHLPKDVLWVFNEHARERITSEIALEILKSAKNITSRRVTVIPVLNVWGRKRVDKGQICLRKNKHGVDTNRNFQTHHRHHYARHGEEYEGPYPLSEKESQVILKHLKEAKQYINVHSGEFAIYAPYDSNAEDIPTSFDIMQKRLRIAKHLCPECKVGRAAKTSSYKAYGTSVDYAITHGVEEAYTFEVFGENRISCKAAFNPPLSLLETIKKKWTEILFSFL